MIDIDVEDDKIKSGVDRIENKFEVWRIVFVCLKGEKYWI